MDRIAAIDEGYVVLILLQHRAAHAPEVTVFEVDRARLKVVALGDLVPVLFVAGTVHVRALLMTRGWLAVFGAQGFQQFGQAVVVDFLHQCQ